MFNFQQRLKNFDMDINVEIFFNFDQFLQDKKVA